MAAATTDPRTEELGQRRREVERQKTAAAAAIDVLRASEESLAQALGQLGADVLAKEARLADAQLKADAAAAHAVKLREEQERTAIRLSELKEEMRGIGVDAFVNGPNDRLDAALGGKDITESLQRMQMVKLVVDRRTDVTIKLRQATQELGVQRVAAGAAAARADSDQRGVEGELRELLASVSAQQRLAADIEARLEARLSEVEALTAVDEQFAEQIRSRQVELAREVAAREAEAREAAARLAAAQLASARLAAAQLAAAQHEAAQLAAARASRSAAAPPAPPSPARSSPVPAVAAPAAPPRTPSPTVSAPTGGMSTVRGIRVASSLAANLEAMLAAAATAGMSFGGGGYRDSQGQIATRMANCGLSSYDIYEKPASQCSPPTARPGFSMHEQGLAIDFTYNGSLITTKTNPGFVWLAANASRFGLYNLPSEPWHWSTNGN